jgi:Holliday junction resolvase RusA-like endonuclease
MNDIVLPLPPTDNRLRMPVLRGKKAFIIKTNEYREWGEQAHRHWQNWKRQNPKFKPYDPKQNEQLQFTYRLFLPSWRTDIFNYNKAIADFLGGGETKRLFTDDHYISLHLLLPVTVDKEHPRVEVCPNPTVFV